MNEEERKCLNDCGFANVTQLLLAYVSLQQENVELKENYKAILKQRDDTNKSAVETIEKYQQENARLKEIENKLIFIKNRVKQGMSQENINKCAIKLVNSYLKEN